MGGEVSLALSAVDNANQTLDHGEMHFITQYESPYVEMAFVYVLQVAFEPK